MSIQGLTALQKRFAAITDTRVLLRELQPRVIREQRLMAPKRAGFLQASILPGPVSETSMQTYAGVKYAAAQEFGARPHKIMPRNKRFLTWPVNASDRRLSGSARKNVKGGWIISWHGVNHPGNRAHPYMMPGAKRAIEKAGLADLITVRWNEAA